MQSISGFVMGAKLDHVGHLSNFSLVLFGSNNQPPTLMVERKWALQCFQCGSLGWIVPHIPLFCFNGDDLFKCWNCHSIWFFPSCVYFDVFINEVPQQLKNDISNTNFTVEEGGHIIGMKAHHKRCFTPSCSSLFLFSAINPHWTYCSMIHISWGLSMNSLLVILDCIHHHPAIDSFPSIIAWKAKSPVMYITMVSEFSDWVSLDLHSICPCVFISIWRCHVATIFRPLVSHGSIVLLRNFPVSFRQINLQMDTSKSII